MAGQKLKSHSGVSKRFRRTGTGKLVRRSAGMRHNLTKKARARKRRLKQLAVVDQSDRQTINRLMPY